MKKIAVIVMLLGACSQDDAADTNRDVGFDAVVTEDSSADTPDSWNDDGGTTRPDVGVDADADTDADRDADAEVDAAPGLPVIAENYCELTADMFCDYYLRCGRMAVADKAECLTVFAEQCNNIYEPHYRAAADAGLLELSESGLSLCAEHLQTVACEKQMLDLDGDCEQMWVGKVSAGGECAPGIESLVCQPSTTCAITTSLCGTCEAAVGAEQACGTDVARCDDGFSCIEGVCVKRGEVGDACSQTMPCRIGASCVNDVCQGFTTVALGEACGQGARCPYNSFCRGGECVAQIALGEACAPNDSCRSGVCELGMCQALRAAGETCNSNPQCVSGRCNQGICGALPGACFE